MRRPTRSAQAVLRLAHRAFSIASTPGFCVQRRCIALTLSPRQKLPPNPPAANFLGTPVCVSSIDQTDSQGRNCPRPTDIIGSPPRRLPNRGFDNSKSLSTIACAIPESGGHSAPPAHPPARKWFRVRFVPPP